MCTVTVSASCKIIDMFVVPIIRTAGCQNVWFNNIYWLVNCNELKPKAVLKYICSVNAFVVAGLMVLCGMACLLYNS